MNKATTPPADLAPAVDLAAMARLSETCRRVRKLRNLAALRLEAARIRQENLRRHLPVVS